MEPLTTVVHGWVGGWVGEETGHVPVDAAVVAVGVGRAEVRPDGEEGEVEEGDREGRVGGGEVGEGPEERGRGLAEEGEGEVGVPGGPGGGGGGGGVGG